MESGEDILSEWRITNYPKWSIMGGKDLSINLKTPLGVNNLEQTTGHERKEESEEDYLVYI